MIRLAFSSVADTAIIPLQDILGLDSRARMNIPGTAEGNWGWRFRKGQIDRRTQERLAELTAIYSRWNGALPEGMNPRRDPHAGRSYDRDATVEPVTPSDARRECTRSGADSRREPCRRAP